MVPVGNYGEIFRAEVVYKEDLDNALTVEAEQKIHAHWEINPDGYFPYCSNCKNEPKGREMTDYCPSCGAKMDGGSI